MSAAEALGLPPGVRFDPTGDELVEFYLLPRALARSPAVPGIIIEDDDTAATSSTSAQHPWKLLKRHRRTDDDEAYFFERVDATKSSDGARQDRSCGRRWTWVGQKRAPDEVLPIHGGGDGEQVLWGKYSLNLQEGRRKGGSTGWVMHEYTVAASPECPLLPVKLCHVSFTGHGQKRQRVPDDDDGDGEGRELQVEPRAAATVPPPHKRAATGSSSMVTAATEMPNQELSEACCARSQEQRFLNYDYCNSSSIGDFWSSDAGFSQGSSIILDPSYPGEPFVLDHQVARNQEFPATQSQDYHQEQQFVNPAGSSIEAHCAALLASDLAIEEEFSVSQLLGVISSPRCPPTTTTPAAYREQQQQNIQSFGPAETADLPLSTDQESCMTEQSHGDMGQFDDVFSGWGDMESFCDTTGIQDDDAMAASQMLAADGCRGGMSWDGHFLCQQAAL